MLVNVLIGEEVMCRPMISSSRAWAGCFSFAAGFLFEAAERPRRVASKA